MFRKTRTLVAMLVSLTILLPGSAGARSLRSQASDERFFPLTSFRIDNDAFWNFFQQRGNVRTFGYPVSRTFQLDGFQVQIFQREIMQLQPDGSVQTLNLLDPGLMPYTRINGSTFPAPDPAVVAATPPVSDPNYDTNILAFVQQQAPDTFEGQPVNFGATFFSTVTADDAPDADPALLPGFDLQIWGAPTSVPAFEPTNRNFIYQRFQRSIMHFDSGCGCTQGLLLADYLKSIITGQNLPTDLEQQARGSKYYRQYAPGAPLWIARPGALPFSDLTNAFEPQQPGGGGTPIPQPVSTWGYGFNVHMWDFSQAGKDQTIGIVKEAGFTWIKQQVEWDAVELAPGQFDWSELDAIINTASINGLKIMIGVVHAPTFYRSPSSGLTPADPTTFGTFMRNVASRYAGRVQAYELWNEENLSREMGVGNVDPSRYLPLLEAGYTGVKAGDFNALGLIGAPSPTGVNIPGQSIDDLLYLQQLYALNNGEVKGFYDALSAHPSGFSNPPNCTPATPQCSLSGGFNNHDSFFAFTRVSQYRNLMSQQGEGAKKIWFTEYGYCSNPSPPPGFEYCASIDESTQSSFLVQAFQMARALDYVAGMMQWNLNLQLAVPQSDEQWGFGIVRSDWSGRPAYFGLSQLPKT
jgi:polysaccharide biosynthesis protein PslG